MSSVLRGFPSAEYDLYASTKTLVRPCSSEKLLIYELETYPVPNACNAICGWTLSKTANPFMTGVLPASPARKGGVEGSHTRISLFLTGCEALPQGRTPARKGGEASIFQEPQRNKGKALLKKREEEISQGKLPGIYFCQKL